MTIQRTHPARGRGDAAITVRGLRRSYRGRPAVDGLDLDVRTGEILALLGPNGAGKTTTTEILEGHRSRDAGEVDVLGCDPASAGVRWRARIGIVLQESADVSGLTVRESVRHFACYYPRPRDVDELIEAVGLTDRRDTRAGALSGGQRRRLDVALGIVGRPELLFLDEPTTGFDPQARRRFWSLIASLRDAGTTILLTTHYLDEAEQLADRVAVIRDGRIVDVDSPERLGGRHLARALLRWRDAEGTHTVESAEPTADVARLAARYGGEVPELTVTRPSLEDVYLDLIGAA